MSRFYGGKMVYAKLAIHDEESKPFDVLEKIRDLEFRLDYGKEQRKKMAKEIKLRQKKHLKLLKRVEALEKLRGHSPETECEICEKNFELP